MTTKSAGVSERLVQKIKNGESSRVKEYVLSLPRANMQSLADELFAEKVTVTESNSYQVGIKILNTLKDLASA